MFKLDKSKSVTVNMTNDAYNYILYDDSMIDESNMEEVEKYESMFPNGFEIKFIRESENSDLIEVEITPYIDDDFQYDRIIELFGGNVIQVQTHDSHVNIRFYNETECKELWQETCEIQINDFNKEYIVTSAGSMYPLWKAIPVK